MRRILGIDLGATKSCMAIMDGKRPVVIPNQEGNRTTPSFVSILKGGYSIGDIAKRMAVTNPQNTLYAIKRFVGKKYLSDELQRIISTYPFKIKCDEKGYVQISTQYNRYSPVEVLSFTLKKMKQAAESFVNKEISDAVIAVPTYFDLLQRQAIKKAGKIAGFNSISALNATMAAALAYGNKNCGENIAIFDLGGGKLDISILEVGEGVFEHKSSSGENMGGDDFDQRILDFLITEITQKSGPVTNEAALSWIRQAAEKAKIDLISATETLVVLPSLKPNTVEIILSRTKFESLIKDLIERIDLHCKEVLNDAKMSPSDINKVILVGAMTRLPCIQKNVRDIFGREAYKGINLDEAVAVGAAIRGGIFAGQVKDMLPLDIISKSIGIENQVGLMDKMIEKNTCIPTRRSKRYSLLNSANGVINIHVLQGEWSAAADNVNLGNFTLNGVPSTDGFSEIEITMDIDANAILHITAESLMGNTPRVKKGWSISFE